MDHGSKLHRGNAGIIRRKYASRKDSVFGTFRRIFSRNTFVISSTGHCGVLSPVRGTCSAAAQHEGDCLAIPARNERFACLRSGLGLAFPFRVFPPLPDRMEYCNNPFMSDALSRCYQIVSRDSSTPPSQMQHLFFMIRHLLLRSTKCVVFPWFMGIINIL